MGRSGAEVVRFSRKILKFVMKIKKNKSLYTNVMNFCADLRQNIIRIENSIPPGLIA